MMVLPSQCLRPLSHGRSSLRDGAPFVGTIVPVFNGSKRRPAVLSIAVDGGRRQAIAAAGRYPV